MTSEKAEESLLTAPISKRSALGREISLTQAVSYPFLRKNQVNMLLLPCLLCFPGLLGYAWRLIHVLRTEGYDACAPDWSLEKLFWYCWDSLKLILILAAFAFILFLPESLTLLPLPESTSALSSNILASTADEKKRQEIEGATEMFPQEQLQGQDKNADKYMEILIKEQRQRQGKYDEYLERQEKKSSPTYAARYSLRGDAYNQLGQNFMAIQDYMKAFIPGIYYVRMALYMILMPFLLGAIVQSSETRSLLHFLNPIRSFRAGLKCFGKSLLVSVIILLEGFLLFVALNWLYYLPSKPINFFIGFLVSSVPLVIIIEVTVHMIAQAFDNYRHSTISSKPSSSLPIPS